MLKKALPLALLLFAFPVRAEVLTGLDRLEAEDFAPLKGKAVGLITNHTGKDRQGRGANEVLFHAPGVRLKAIFTPEHGFLGTIPGGDAVAPSTDPATGLPVYSLYGTTKRPTPEMLAGLDALVFDIQDVGARFYTYLTTMAMAMEEAAGRNIEFVVLDRPNPLGGVVVEGPVKIPEIRHFTSYLPVPVRHGLTAGEMAGLYNATLETPAKLVVIPMSGWRRDMLWQEAGFPWVSPSPNIRNPVAALLYPGIGCFEATNLSVGRGTDAPFEWVGAPWLDAPGIVHDLKKLKLPGFKFKEENQSPQEDLYKGVRCYGIRITVTDAAAARPVDLFVHLMTLLRERHGYEFQPRWDEVRLVVGNDDFEKRYLGEESAEAILESFKKDTAQFERTRKTYLLYP
jgi:uncharacterized protein YbbC (DUF1343 family)